MIRPGKWTHGLAERPRAERVVACAFGAAQVFAFAPYRLEFLAPLSLAALLWLVSGHAPRRAALTAFCFGLGLFAAGTYWLYVSLNILGGLWPPIAILMMACMVVALAAFVAGAGGLTAWLAHGRAAWVRTAVVFPAAWTVFEWLRGWMFTGFPWLSIGYSQVESPLGALAPLGGVYAVSWATALVAGLLMLWIVGGTRERIASLAGLAALVAGALALDAVTWTEDTGRDFRVSLVQGAIPQERKWRPEQLEPTLELYRELTLAQETPDLVVWPEAAIPAMPFEIPEFIAGMHEAMVAQGTQLLTGILTYDLDTSQYRNTLWALGEEPGMYFKRHLVAFGEYFPLPKFVRNWMRLMNLPSENIARGPDEQPLLVARGVPLAATICYELAFGAEQLPFLPEAELLVNVSNDGWFGDTIAPHQHLQIGQMRARETGRYLVRSTNTGITAVVDPAGRILERIPQFRPGVVNATVRPHRGATPYVRFGNWAVIVPLISLLVLVYPSRPFRQHEDQRA